MRRNLVALVLIGLLVNTSWGMVIEHIVAKVNGEPITSSMVNDELEMMRFTLSQQGQTAEQINETLPLQRGAIIDRLIEDKVILLAARARKYDIPDEQITLEVNRQLEATKSRFPSEEVFLSELKKQGKTLSELKKEYYQEVLDEKLRQEIVRREVISQIDTSDNNIKKYNEQKYTKIHIFHILVKTRQEAQEIYYQLKDGADFAKLARGHSIDASADKGGDMGMVARGVMIPSFEEAAFALNEGEISEPVETPFGFHVLKVEKIETPENIPSLSPEELNDLRQEYYNKELQYRYDNWIRALKVKAVIEINDESVKK